MKMLCYMLKPFICLIKGDVIYTAETDKTTVEIEAQASGTIRPTGEEGVKYKVGDVIGTIE